jgi:hypothetical protein
LEIAEKTKERAKIGKKKLVTAWRLQKRIETLKNDSRFLSSNISI